MPINKRYKQLTARYLTMRHGLDQKTWRKLTDETKIILLKLADDEIKREIIQTHGTYSNYLEMCAQRRGFKSRYEYNKFLAKNMGYKSYNEYQNAMARKRGFKTNSEYRMSLYNKGRITKGPDGYQRLECPFCGYLNIKWYRGHITKRCEGCKKTFRRKEVPRVKGEITDRSSPMVSPRPPSLTHGGDGNSKTIY